VVLLSLSLAESALDDASTLGPSSASTLDDALARPLDVAPALDSSPPAWSLPHARQIPASAAPHRTRPRMPTRIVAGGCALGQARVRTPEGLSQSAARA
jgi:hypothetical protein